MIFLLLKKYGRDYLVESFTSDSYSACLFPFLLTHLSSGFPLDFTNICSPGPRSLTVGTEPTEMEMNGRKLGIMYFLWDIVKRFRARSKDSGVYFHGAGSRCSTESLAAWIHSGTATDEVLDCGCQQTCLLRKAIPCMFTSQTSTGFEVKAAYYSG